MKVKKSWAYLAPQFGSWTVLEVNEDGSLSLDNPIYLPITNGLGQDSIAFDENYTYINSPFAFNYRFAIINNEDPSETIFYNPVGFGAGANLRVRENRAYTISVQDLLLFDISNPIEGPILLNPLNNGFPPEAEGPGSGSRFDVSPDGKYLVSDIQGGYEVLDVSGNIPVVIHTLK